MFCRHDWGFPRRRAEFFGHANVDVQTCAKCGSLRLSPVQFGPQREPAVSVEEIQEVGHEAPSRS
ncbi:MAG: hypothetical protein LAQ69_14330 [Acidobacteriia bacterium]|nr:hypothetical protein [Terriglobia bacterium]